MKDPGLIGIWLLVISVVVIVVEMVLAGLWSVKVAKRARELSARLATERAELQADLVRMKAALEETRVLWRPYGRLLRWARHPLAIALMESYARRKAPMP
ncbi:MAG TPA: hypothetical protein VLU92_06270 [Candidatus Dormibacteraeota bacterium]|nr:hypothetical protein [Candidatus Dormibacteraeota bacterium]